MLFHEKPITAENFLRKAIRAYPNNGSYWVYLAIVEYRIHDQKDALNSALKAKSLLNNETANNLYNLIQNKKSINIKNN